MDREAETRRPRPIARWGLLEALVVMLVSVGHHSTEAILGGPSVGVQARREHNRAAKRMGGE